MTSALKNLSVVGREVWGAGLSPDWPASPNWPPIHHAPQFLVVHHTAMSNDQGGTPVIRAIWQYHALTQERGDIRYHYLISQDGTIYEGRWSGGRPSNIFVEGGQTMVSNTGKIGVVLLGQFEPSVSNPAPGEPTPAALQALVKLLGAIAFDQNLDPLGESYHSIEDKTYPVIAGHRDHYPGTQCPGRNLYTLLGNIRQQVATEVQRLREQDQQEPTERVITLAPATTQVAWGKSTWPNLVWGTPYLYSGVWGEVPYQSLIEVNLPPEILDGQITGLELLLTGKYAHYLRETGGAWQATVLEGPLRGNTDRAIPFETLQSAQPVALFSPSLSSNELAPQQENRLVIDPTGLATVQEATRSGYLSIRLAGPEQGRRLFAWDSGQSGSGPIIKITVQAEPQYQEMSDLVINEISFEEVEPEQVKLTALIANAGQVQTSAAVEVAFLVDDQYITSETLEPLAPGASATVQAQTRLSLTGIHKITVVLDDKDTLPEEEKGNNTLTEYFNFGHQPDLLADVTILDVKMGQDRLIEGNPVTFAARVQNVGTGITGDLLGVAFWVDQQFFTFGTCGPLMPGAVQDIRANAPWPATAGRHKLIAIADDVDRFPEQSETNNLFEFDFYVYNRTEGG